MRSRNNPLLFVTDILGATPEPWQADALDAVGQHDRVSIRSGHGVGKTTLEAWLILWFLLTRKNCKVPVAANSQDQLRDTIWPEIAKWHRKLPEALKGMIDVQAERVVVVHDPEGAFAVRRTASKDNPEALQGFHAEHLLFLIDEASGIPDIVFEVGMGALSTPGAKVVMAGNPTRTSGFFFDTHHSLRDRWHTLHVSCLDVPRAQGHIEDIKTKYGDSSNAWRVRVLGEFPTADDETVIPLELVQGAVGREVSKLDYYPIWGVDIARFGDPSDILIDAIGLGAGVYDRCKELGLPVRAINVGESAATRDNCMRLRDELWFKGREWFQERICSIPKDDALVAELTAPIYTFTSTGKMVVESKSDMKKRGLRSPDLADAFLLTLAGQDKRRTRQYRRPEPRRESAWAA
jgi:hypothetical protein